MFAFFSFLLTFRSSFPTLHQKITHRGVQPKRTHNLFPATRFATIALLHTFGAISGFSSTIGGTACWVRTFPASGNFTSWVRPISDNHHAKTTDMCFSRTPQLFWTSVQSRRPPERQAALSLISVLKSAEASPPLPINIAKLIGISQPSFQRHRSRCPRMGVTFSTNWRVGAQ